VITITIIVILGPVGVGKSTMIKTVEGILKREGFRVKKAFMKTFHGPSYLLWKFALKIMIKEKKDISLSKVAPWIIISRLNERLAWNLTLISALLDIISIPAKVLVLSVRSYRNIVLCEEYLYGTLMDYIYTYIHAKSRKGSVILDIAVNLFYRLLLKYPPYLTVILDADNLALLERWRRRGYGEPQQEYLRFQKIFFNSFFVNRTSMNVMPLDTTGRDIHSVAYEIVSLIKFMIKKSRRSAMGVESKL